MNTIIDQGAAQQSARIYQFPTGGRAGIAQHAAVDRTMERNPDIMYGSAWYHDEAIAEIVAPTNGLG